MTGYTVHTGSNEKFSEGWDRIFNESKNKVKEKPLAEKTTKKKSTSKSKTPVSSKAKTNSKSKSRKK